MPTKEISEFNKAWGICGFTSALTHLYDSDDRLKAKIDESAKKEPNTIKLGLLTEVLTFLRYVTEYRKDLIDGLNALNKALDSKSFDKGVAGFIEAAEEAVRKQAPIEGIISNLYQCALTPEALTLYLDKMCGYTKAKLTTDGDPGGRGILGVMNKKGELLHWVYRDGAGKVYNWGAVIEPDEWKDHKYGLKYGDFDHVGCHISFG